MVSCGLVLCVILLCVLKMGEGHVEEELSSWVVHRAPGWPHLLDAGMCRLLSLGVHLPHHSVGLTGGPALGIVVGV